MTTPSGPGQFSKRTDRAVSAASESLPNAGYGENRDYQEQKAGAPMAGSEAPAMNLDQMLAGMRPETIPMDSESQQPDVPVTDGAASGPGAGTEVLASDPSTDAGRAKMLASLTALEYAANRPGSSDSARNLIRQIKANLGV